MLPFVNRELTIDRMVYAFSCNTPKGLKANFQKTTVPIAGQGLGEGKTYLGENVQAYVKKHRVKFEQYQDVRDALIEAYYLRVQLNRIH